MTVGRSLALRREERGWDQAALATIMDTTVRTISRWETDAGPIPLAKQLKLQKLGLLTADDVDVELPTGQIAPDAPPAWFVQFAEQIEAKLDEMHLTLDLIKDRQRRWQQVPDQSLDAEREDPPAV